MAQVISEKRESIQNVSGSPHCLQRGCIRVAGNRVVVIVGLPNYRRR